MTDQGGSRPKTVTFILTDVEGSTPLWESHPEAMDRAIQRHHAIVAENVERAGGTLPIDQGEGDARFAAFDVAAAAVRCAVALQIAFHHEPWPREAPVRVRIGVHTGRALYRAGNYFGEAVSRTARIRGLAVGGQTLLSQATAQTVADDLPPSCSVRDLGLVRLKGLSRPEQVFQLDHDALPSDFPAFEEPSDHVSNLPVASSSFVGREVELVDVHKRLDAARLVTLTGPGGVGKTRLASEVALIARDDFDHGAWFIDLAPARTADDGWRVLADGLGVREEPGRALTDTTVGHLRSQHALLLLDNCEQIVVPAAEIARRLLDVCPRVHILATSRQLLGLSGETIFEVTPLSIGAVATDHPDTLIEHSATRLFVDRARDVSPGFAADLTNAGHITAICRRLDGIPLAIELAASQAAALPVETIRSLLDDRLDAFIAPGPVPPRQKTLRAAIDWSYELLSSAERTLLMEMSVFRAGFTLELAGVVSSTHANAAAVVPTLARLVNASLVQRSSDRTRYWMLESIREYAYEALLQESDESAALKRLLRWIVSCEDAWEVEGDEAIFRWKRALGGERDAVRAALEWAITANKIELGLLAVTGPLLDRLWTDGGHWTEARGFVTEFLDRWRTEDELRARGLVTLGSFERLTADHESAAQEHLESAIEWLRPHGSTEWLGAALCELGDLLSLNGDYTTALPLLEESVSMMEAPDRPPSRDTLAPRHNLACVQMRLGDLKTARTTFERNEELGRTLGDWQIVAGSLMFRAVVAYELGRTDDAELLMGRCASVAREADDPRFLSGALSWLVHSAEQRGDFGTARLWLEEWVDLWTHWDDVADARLTQLLLRLARAAVHDEDIPSAKVTVRAAAQRLSTDRPEDAMDALRTMAEIAVAESRPASAVEYLATAAPLTDDPTTSSSEDGSDGSDHATLTEMRAALGEDGFAAAWRRGIGRSPADAIEAIRAELALD
jgi:predicted ATPase/class 3 adenylate cyclase